MKHVVLALVLVTCSCAQPSPPPAPRPGAGRRIPALSFDTLDADRDATISREEFEALAKAMFERLDTNADRVLSKAEYEVLQARQRERQGAESSPRRGRSPRGLPPPP